MFNSASKKRRMELEAEHFLVVQALEDYKTALKNREHGAIAASKCLDKIFRVTNTEPFR